MTDEAPGIIIEIFGHRLHVGPTPGRGRIRNADLLEKHLQDGDKKGKGDKGKEYSEDIKKHVQRGITPVRAGIAQYFEKIPHCCKDSSLSSDLKKMEKPVGNLS
jgi:hypothetical protein